MATRRRARRKSGGKAHALGLWIASRHLPRHGTFFIALIVGVIVLLVSLWLAPAFAVVFGAIAMFVTYLSLVALMLPLLDSDFLRLRADEADTPTGLIFAVVIGVVAVCSATLFMALNGKDGPLVVEVSLSIISVLLSWFVVHTMASLHYAYEFYERQVEGDPNGVAGGLDFPEGDKPDGLAFLYFGYVIGTAFAVSDIRVTSSNMRRIVLIHSVFSYFFNTLIVAATVNVAVAVGAG
ncbi:membrane protein [Devosia yakushimensis]|uniref:Membrane protein n=1 Tax=Devosia yakushimensis TaxID=470028 RepID=A0ABQ5UBI4_9HYPH|nr:DUF1345 domain-containing protein [Devosia yakushimensis]GLQ09196.1 membrane protein [Devosia yakushimensis]